MNRTLQTLINRLVQPREIIKTDHPLHYAPTSAKVCIFDIYGTLFSSAAGDVGPDSAIGNAQAFYAALVDAGLDPEEGQKLDEGATLIDREIARCQEARKRGGDPHPEINILVVWKRVLCQCGYQAVTGLQHQCCALSYECRINPIWPMEDLLTTLGTLKSKGKLLGILSNAQFYTPLLMETLLERSLEQLGFDPQLSLWSYVEGLGKPSPELFTTVNDRLRQRGVLPAEVIYVGNDMYKDILPAAKAGWQTILFAGDTRSLRLRQDLPEVADTRPDMVINKLVQLTQIL